jgi:uncharacterized protein YjbI with pentapeptide repeats
MAPQAQRDAILGALAVRIGLPSKGPWSLQLEWEDNQNLLRESGKKSQWMRNLVIAREASGGRKSAFLIVYADHEGLSFPHVLNSEAWKEFLKRVRTNVIGVHTVSYQSVLRTILDVVRDEKEPNLNASDFTRAMASKASAKLDRSGDTEACLTGKQLSWANLNAWISDKIAEVGNGRESLELD